MGFLARVPARVRVPAPTRSPAAIKVRPPIRETAAVKVPEAPEAGQMRAAVPAEKIRFQDPMERARVPLQERAQPLLQERAHPPATP